MKKNVTSITNPDDLDKVLKHTSPFTWVSLGIVAALLIAFFAWSLIYKIAIKITGIANVNSNEITLHIEESRLNELAVGQKVYINDKNGEILSIKDDGQPVVSNMNLEDGEYTYSIVLKEIHPFEFLIGK